MGMRTTGATDGGSTTVRVTARVKKEVRERLRQRGVKPRVVMIRIFVGAILLAVENHLAEVESLTLFTAQGRLKSRQRTAKSACAD